MAAMTVSLMKRLMHILAAGAFFLASAAAAMPADGEAAAMPTDGAAAAMLADGAAAYQYLIVLENSARMDRQREVALDTVHELILGGIYGRIREGEILGVWTFRDRVKQDQFRPIPWIPGRARDVANDVYRVLRDDGFSREPNLDEALSAVQQVASEQRRLVVFLVVSGTQPIRGTAFDEEIRAIYEEHGDAMRKNRKPFVTVLVFENGQTAGHATTPGGRRIYLPPQAQPVAEEIKPADVSAPPEPAPEPPPKTEVTPPPPPVPLGVSEIEQQLREAAQERQRRLAEAEARRLAEQVEVPEETGVRLSETGAPKHTAGEMGSDLMMQVAEDRGSGMVVLPATQGWETDDRLPAATVAAELAMPTSSEAVENPDEGDGMLTPGMVIPAGGAAGSEGRRTYLVVAVLLFILAAGLSLYLYHHSGARRVRPSAISRSMDRVP
jgi:hypothetical protein